MKELWKLNWGVVWLLSWSILSAAETAEMEYSPTESVSTAFDVDCSQPSKKNDLFGLTEALLRGQSAWYPQEEAEPGLEYPRFTDEYPEWEEHDVRSWSWQVLPTGLIYPSYLAGRKEPRLGCEITDEHDYGWLWDITLGGRAPILRYGTKGAVNPEGWQIDLEGAALLRLDFERGRDLAGTDYRAGVPLSYGAGNWQYKFAYYHVSSHLGDNYILENFRMPRVQYVRDELVLGASWRPWSFLRLFAELGWAFNTGATTDPWEVQFGAEFSQQYEKGQSQKGSPFLAVDTHLFEELDFGGYFNAQAGWQWRGATNNLLRLGVEFFTGCDDQFQFHYTYSRKVGFGLWYDF
ncbi:MAG: DUF1207 domain-containing protein [Planctomycetia bacterium]|nr:DUF1207 domain-containing protein [Planctomycetia bacterium]